MDGTPHPLRAASGTAAADAGAPAADPPRSIAILDRRPEYARMLATLVAEQLPDAPVRTFADTELDEAERWVRGALMPVTVLADVAAGEGRVIARARAWRAARGGVSVIALFDAQSDMEVVLARHAGADLSMAKPGCRADWSRSFGSLRAAYLAPLAS